MYIISQINVWIIHFCLFCDQLLRENNGSIHDVFLFRITMRHSFYLSGKSIDNILCTKYQAFHLKSNINDISLNLHISLADPGVPILLFGHTNFTKRSCIGSWCPLRDILDPPLQFDGFMRMCNKWHWFTRLYIIKSFN